MPTRRQLVSAALVSLALASVLGLPFLGNLYAANRFPGVTPGMTRAQVDRHLRGFMSFPSRYNAMEPTDSAVAYEFLGLGKFAQIKIIFDANGVVVDTIPSFSN